MSEQKPSHEVEGIVRRASRQDCVEARIWGRVPKMSAVLKFHKNIVASRSNQTLLVKYTNVADVIVGVTKRLCY